MKSHLFWLILHSVVALLGLVKPAAANGGHVHLGGVFFLLLGGLVFVAGIGVILYMLFRPNPNNDAEPKDDDFDDVDEKEY